MGETVCLFCDKLVLEFCHVRNVDGYVIYSWLLTLLSIFAIVFNRVYILYKRRLLQRSEKQVEQFNAVEKR